MTLIVPETLEADPRYQAVGVLTRIEADTLVVGYKFDLRTNEIETVRVPNPGAGTEHRFTAYRLTSQASKLVSIVSQINLQYDNREGDEQ